ncbi:NAD(P)-dependent oxidoreductase [Celeribacter sp. PS-C1]|uniref:NAD-dependent epimerase/dehydratase family protein n=1 Tax=Celeribacter sp. PS-C1 TaxID=2820813 RepID=UPI001C675EC2|nr:NAD(P)-dependent oxidoreductase [Celeribacter sp. PS-C1]MBW6416459.1 NAD(P)-dependent oxidoreductase [Celeribacter sp. PS-C1]
MFETRHAFLGASGRIGRLLRVAERMTVDRSMLWQFRGHVPADTRGFQWSDFSDPDPLMAVNRKAPISTLLVLSGVTQSGDKSDPVAMRANITLVEQAISAAAQAGVPRVLVASSSAVYGAGKGQPFREAEPLDPVNAYGASKAEMEALAARRARDEGIELCALRIGNVAGADMLLGNAMARRGAPLTLDVFPDGAGPRRSYIGPQTLLQVLKALSDFEGRLPPCLNVAGTSPVEMNALLDAAQVPWEARSKTDQGHQNITLECSALAEICAGVDLSGGAEDIIADWQGCLERE